VRRADNLPPSCADVLKTESLNLLEPSGPAQAYNGIALPSPFNIEQKMEAARNLYLAPGLISIANQPL